MDEKTNAAAKNLAGFPVDQPWPDCLPRLVVLSWQQAASRLLAVDESDVVERAARVLNPCAFAEPANGAEEISEERLVAQYRARRDARKLDAVGLLVDASRGERGVR
jgi:hypothetical protein